MSSTFSAIFVKKVGKLNNYSDAKKLIKKIKTAYQVSTNPELAIKLGLTVSAIEQWSKKNKVPEKYIFQCTSDTGVSLEWLLDEDKPTFAIYGGKGHVNNVNDGGIGIVKNNKESIIDKATLELFEEAYLKTKNNEKDIDEATLSLFKEAYTKAKGNDKINHLRLYLMEFK